MGKLIVTILGLKGVKSNDWIGNGDPYVKVYCAGREFRTSVKKGENPVFNEAFTFMVADPNTEQIFFKVMDEDVAKDDVMGEYRLSLMGLVRGQPLESWYLLQNAKSGQIGVRLLAEDFGDLPQQQHHATPPQQQQQHPVAPPVAPPQQYGMPPAQQYGMPPGQYAPPPAAGIRVVFASFGGANITPMIMQRAAAGPLQFAPGQYVPSLGDPCPMTYKDMCVVTVDPTCNACRVTVAAESQPLAIYPGPHQSSPRTVPPRGSDIINANYGGRDVTEICRGIFFQRGVLTLDQHPAVMFGDQMPGVQKALVVTYQTVAPDGIPHRAVAFWLDGEAVQLPRC